MVYEKSLNFDHALPQYKTQNGVLPNSDPLVKHSPPLMWAEALDLLFAAMKEDGVALGEILAISGSGQQHGSVYFNPGAAAALARLDPQKSPGGKSARHFLARDLADLDGFLHRASNARKSARNSAASRPRREQTGSDTFERFTGPQIRKFYKTEPAAYAKTAYIALVSSFMASLLAGKIAPIDHGDGAGMNLMDIREKTWHPGRSEGHRAASWRRNCRRSLTIGQVIGPVSPYFVKKYGLNPAALAAGLVGRQSRAASSAWASSKPGKVAISLGTSDTFFGPMQKCRTDEHGEGHVFGSPAGDYMTLDLFQKRFAGPRKNPGRYTASRTGRTLANCWRTTSPAITAGFCCPGLRRKSSRA